MIIPFECHFECYPSHCHVLPVRSFVRTFVHLICVQCISTSDLQYFMQLMLKKYNFLGNRYILSFCRSWIKRYVNNLCFLCGTELHELSESNLAIGYREFNNKCNRAIKTRLSPKNWFSFFPIFGRLKPPLPRGVIEKK